VQETVEN